MQTVLPRGYNLLLVARREDRLNALAEDLQQRHGINVRTLVADLSQQEGIQRVETVLRKMRRLRFWSTMQEPRRSRRSSAAPRSSIEAINTLNTTALMRLTLAVLPRFVENNHGTLINIASVVAFHARAGSAVYSATKAPGC